MTTSNSTDWSLNRDQVIKGALRKLVVLPSGGTPTVNQTNDAAEALNSLVKVFQADGMPVWKILSKSFTTVAGTKTYNIGVAQTISNPKPLRVLEATYRVSGGADTVPMNVVDRYDFIKLPDGESGTPINLYYQPLLTSGTINLWPTPDTSTTTITIHYQSPFEDMDGASDDFDFPAEWMQALIFNLAWSLAPEYGLPPTDRNILAKEAQYWHDYALSMGTEEGSIFLRPDTTRG